MSSDNVHVSKPKAKKGKMKLKAAGKKKSTKNGKKFVAKKVVGKGKGKGLKGKQGKQGKRKS